MAACLQRVAVGSKVFHNLRCFGLKHVEIRHFHQCKTTRRKIYTLKGVQCLIFQSNFSKCAPLCSFLAVRNNSGEATKLSNEELSNFIPEPPEPPSIPVPDVQLTNVPEQLLNSLNEPTLASIGLGGWTPPGILQQCIEAIHCTLEIPWWSSIVVCTVILRILLFPLMIKSQRNAARLSNHMPIMMRLQERFTEARSSGDPIQMARAGYELQSFMEKNQVKPLQNFLVPMAQAPIFLSMFFGLRKMATVPVEGFKDGGIYWFTDLSIPDPTYALPLLTATTLALTIELGVDGMKAQNMGHTFKWVLRSLPVIILIPMINFPSAMLCYWFTSNAFSLVQAAILKIPAVRKYFKIEVTIKHPKSDIPKKKFVEGFKESWNNAKMAQLVEERQRLDAVRFKEAGQGPIQKTYLYDPTKSKKKPDIRAKPRS